MSEAGQVFHSNHYLVQHPGVIDTVWLQDSKFRIKRVEELCHELGVSPSMGSIQGLFTDEKNYPFAICRAQEGGAASATLFNIVMDLEEKVANVILGRPTAPEGIYELAF